ncbi:hypothetical protein Tco_0433290 [Tanacetum coccineum]
MASLSDGPGHQTGQGHHISKPNGELLTKSILKGTYQYKQILELGDENATPPVPNTYRFQNDTNLSETEQNQVEADDQEMHILLLDMDFDGDDGEQHAVNDEETKA